MLLLLFEPANFLMRIMTLPIAISFLALFCLSCKPAQSIRPESTRSDTYFPISIDGKELQLQLALKKNEQQRGLMHRKRLKKNHGMLFLFDSPRQLSFWMADTKIPLDIGYFDSQGQLLEIHKLFPYSKDSVYSSSKKALIAVETNRDWYARNKVTTGARINMQKLAVALKARGHNSSEIIF